MRGDVKPQEGRLGGCNLHLVTSPSRKSENKNKPLSFSKHVLVLLLGAHKAAGGLQRCVWLLSILQNKVDKLVS